MLNPKNVWDESNVVNVDFKLDDRSRAILQAFVKQEGFDIIQHLMVDVCRDFNTALMNTSATDKEAVVLNHIAAKVAAQIYQGFFERLAQELEVLNYNSTTGTIDNPELAPVSPDFQ